jgi:hypothetical protein
MKIKVIVVEHKEIEVETENPIFEKLDNYWRTTDSPVREKFEPMIDEAIEAIETKMGIPFGDEGAKETIVAVCAMDGEAILEW